MNQRLLFFTLILVSFFQLNAQDPVVIFYEDFDGGLNTFTTGAGSPRGATWQWTPNGRADRVVVNGTTYNARFYGNNGPIGSPTAANGAAQFNSDAYDNNGQGPFPSPQTDTLTSPVIDCSEFDQVTLTFYQYARVFIDDYTLVQVSGDGGNSWADYRINEREFSNEINAIKPQPPADPEEYRVVLDISDIAGGRSQVQVRFIWDDGDYYFWMIDDVALIESPDRNLAVSNFLYPLASYATPASQIGIDTFGFAAVVSNHGKLDATNVVVKAYVINAQGQEFYTDSVIVNNLPAGYRDSLVLFEDTFAPELPTGTYGVIYEVYSRDNPEDFYVSDNGDGDIFIVTGNLFSKEDGFLDELAEVPIGFRIDGDYQMGNYYRMGPAGKDFVAEKAIFGAFRPQADGPIAGNVVTILLLKVKDRVDPNFDNFNINSSGSADPDDDLELVGFGTHTFAADHNALDGIEVTLEDFDGNPVRLTANGRYFLVADYEGASNKLIHVVSDDHNYNSGVISSLFFSDGEWGGLGPGNQAVMRLQIMLSTSRDEVPLPETAMQVFPNPASDLLQVQLDLEKSGDALLVIADINGRILQMQPYRNVSRELLTLDVSAYTAGTYLLRLSTDLGTRTEKITVTR